jgi:hypothetical protein
MQEKKIHLFSGDQSMNSLSIPAHFDGEHILLDEPVQLEPNTKLMVIVLPSGELEREAWQRLSVMGLARAYDDTEEGYSLDSLKEVNAEYEGR